MSIRFRCPGCRKKIEAPDQMVGRVVDCPRCGEPLTIPYAETEPHFESDVHLKPAVPAEPDIAAEGQGVAAASTPAARPRSRAPATEAPLVPPAMKIDFEELIDMTAMVDIVFFLLIFFLVTSMHALDSTIPLPAPTPQEGSESRGRSSNSADSDESSVTVQIDANDVIRVEGTEVFSSQDLLFRLRDLRNGAGRPDKLLVVGSADASHGTAVMVLDAGHEVGMESVRLAVREESE